MPKIITSAYADTVFFVPLNKDKSEGFWTKPFTRTQYNTAKREAMLEAGADTDLAEAMTTLKLMESNIVDWKGFYAPTGEDIPYKREVLRDLWENDMAIFMQLYLCVRDVARLGEIDDRKN